MKWDGEYCIGESTSFARQALTADNTNGYVDQTNQIQYV